MTECGLCETQSRVEIHLGFVLKQRRRFPNGSINERKERRKAGSSAKGFRPLGDRVFVTYTEELERTAGRHLRS